MAGDITTIARPYRRGLRAAQETGQVAGWSDALGLLATIGATRHGAPDRQPQCAAETVRDIVLQVAGDTLPWRPPIWSSSWPKTTASRCCPSWRCSSRRYARPTRGCALSMSAAPTPHEGEQHVLTDALSPGSGARST